MRSSWRVAFYGCCKFVVQLCSRCLFGLRAYGQNNVPAHGGALLLSNHQSFLDPPLIGACLPRQLGYMARHTLFRSRLFGECLGALGVFPVRRGKADKAAMQLAIEQLRSGRLVVMFPEATRTRDGKLQPIKGGFALLVRRAGTPVVPVAVDGTYRAWPRSRRLPRPAKVRILYGRPIPPEDFEAVTGEEAASRLSREISSLLETLRRLP